jgi:hypothetical protein
MKDVRGRVGSLPVIFNSFKKETIVIHLYKEKITIYPDGSLRRYVKKPPTRRY